MTQKLVRVFVAACHLNDEEENAHESALQDAFTRKYSILSSDVFNQVRVPACTASPR